MLRNFLVNQASGGLIGSPVKELGDETRARKRHCAGAANA